MKLLRKIFPAREVYTELSKEDVIKRLYTGNVATYDNQLVAIAPCIQMHEGSSIQIKRAASIFESFRGAGVVSFKLLSLEIGTKITYDIYPCSKSVIIKGATAITLFLIVLAMYIFYLFGIQIFSVGSVFVAWILTGLVVHNGLTYHILQLKSYAEQLIGSVTNVPSMK